MDESDYLEGLERARRRFLEWIREGPVIFTYAGMLRVPPGFLVKVCPDRIEIVEIVESIPDPTGRPTLRFRVVATFMGDFAFMIPTDITGAKDLCRDEWGEDHGQTESQAQAYSRRRGSRRRFRSRGSRGGGVFARSDLRKG